LDCLYPKPEHLNPLSLVGYLLLPNLNLLIQKERGGQLHYLATQCSDYEKSKTNSLMISRSKGSYEVLKS